jgi:DNA replication protein DnaC
MEPISKFTEQWKLRTYTPEQIKASEEFLAEKRAADAGCHKDCPICHGEGLVRFGDGPIQYCPNVNLLKLFRPERFGISTYEAQNFTWESMSGTTGSRQAMEAIQAVTAQGGGWVYLWGGYGTGKTRILKTAVLDALTHARQAFYATLPEILDKLKPFSDDQADPIGSRLEYWTDLPILAIDEVDKRRGTDYRVERQFMLMDTRYVQACEKRSITLLAGNLNPAMLDPYLYDRIRDKRFRIVELQGPSFRPGMEGEG